MTGNIYMNKETKHEVFYKNYSRFSHVIQTQYKINLLFVTGKYHLNI